MGHGQHPNLKMDLDGWMALDNWTVSYWNQNIPREFGRYGGCWSPGSLVITQSWQPWYWLCRRNRSLSSTRKDISVIPEWRIMMMKTMTNDEDDHDEDDDDQCWDISNQFSINHKISNIRCSKSLNLTVSGLVLQLSWPNPMKPGVKLRMKM